MLFDRYLASKKPGRADFFQNRVKPVEADETGHLQPASTSDRVCRIEVRLCGGPIGTRVTANCVRFMASALVRTTGHNSASLDG